MFFGDTCDSLKNDLCEITFIENNSSKNTSIRILIFDSDF